MANRTGENSADMWSNTQKDGQGKDYQPLVDTDGILKTKPTNSSGTTVNPATEEKQDSISAKQDDVISGLGNIETNQTDGSQKSQSVDGSGNNIGGKFYDIISETYKGLQFNDVSPQICSQDYLLALSEGDITGHTPFTKYGRISGVNNTLVDMWYNGTATPALYVFPPSAIQFNVTSSSAQDGVGGTGILTLKIEGLDADYNEISETVTMNGTANVTTSNSYFRINSCYALTVGSSEKAVGTITVKNTGGTVTYAAIQIGNTVCRNLIYTVPAGKTLFLTSLTVASGAGGNALKLNAVIFTPKYRLFGSDVFYPAGELLTLNTETVRRLEIPAVFPEKTDVKMSLLGDYASGGTTCVSAVRGWIE